MGQNDLRAAVADHIGECQLHRVVNRQLAVPVGKEIERGVAQEVGGGAGFIPFLRGVLCRRQGRMALLARRSVQQSHPLAAVDILRQNHSPGDLVCRMAANA